VKPWYLRRRARGDRGAVFVEAAFVLPVLLTFVFGIIEFGFGWRDKVTVETATRAGARTGSNLGKAAQSDYSVVQTTLSALGSSVPQSNIDMIVVFNANSSGTIDPTCKSGVGVTNLCNVYLPSTFSLAQSSYTCSGSAPDRFWCETGRVVAQSSGPDYLGVYIKARHNYLTGIFGSGPLTLESTTVMRLEPG